MSIKNVSAYRLNKFDCKKLGGNYIKTRKNKINSRYLDRENRRNTYKEWIRTIEAGRQVENGRNSSDLRSKIEQALKNVEKDLEQDGINFSRIDYSGTRNLPSTDLNVEDARQIKEIKSIDVSAHEVKAERNNSVYDNVLKLKDARKIYRNVVNYVADNFGAIVLNF